MQPQRQSDSWTWLWAFVALDALSLFVLLPRPSLILDELLDILTVRVEGWDALISSIPKNSGGVPLSYFARWLSMQWLGETNLAVRLPSALFSVAACPGIYLLGRRFGLRYPLLAVAIFVLLPLQFRYAMEARAYSQALCVSIWTTVAFFRWLDRGGVANGILYALLVVVGLYTQPYSIFVPLAHLAWLLVYARRLLFPAIAAVSSAILVFVPWYLYGARIWQENLTAMYPVSTIGPRAILMILREISGAGYVGAALLIAAITSAHWTRARLYWLFYLLIPIAGVVLADIVFVYFLAIRQMIFVLAPIAILTAAGIESLWPRRAWAAFLLLLTIVGAFVYQDVRLFLRPREDWAAAARLLAGNGCILFAPADSKYLYGYFDASLISKDCTEQQLSAADTLLLAVSPYGDQSAFERRLAITGWSKISEANPAGPKVQLYRRRSEENK